jgi:Secretion system C-terminal sorting domain/Carboxypeptidase regulatory-like domain
MKSAVKTFIILMLSQAFLFGIPEFLSAQEKMNTCTISGIVSNIQSGKLLSGALISLGTSQCTTDTNGFYSITVDEGTYNINYQRSGYQDHTEENVVATTGNNLNIDVGLWETMYGPAFVVASTNQTDTECDINWTPTGPPQYLYYDDGTAEDYLVYNSIGNAHAVKFTPPAYPCYVKGGKIYVGDGSFPAGGNFLGSSITLKIFDDKAPWGLPYNILATQTLTVNNYLWVEFEGFNVEITEGSFYLAMFQDSLLPSAVPIGMDLESPTANRSYAYFDFSNHWAVSPSKDFLIRAKVSTDPGDGFSAPDPLAFKITRYSNFDPDGSILAGDSLILNDSLLSTQYTDTDFYSLDQGWYAYGVAALYDQNGPKYSDYALSNIVGHENYFNVSFILNTNIDNPATQAEVTICGLDFPYKKYFALTGEDTTCLIEHAWEGTYCLKISRLNLEDYCDSNVLIHSDTSIVIQLNEAILPIGDLFVDETSSIASWNAPEQLALSENFENLVFPPEGWQATSNCPGWFQTNDGSSTSFFIPEWETKYACVNNNDSVNTFDCNDILLTQQINLKQADNFSLSFDYFFSKADAGQKALVSISNDGGNTWQQLESLDTITNWSQKTIDLSDFSGWDTEGASQIKIKFQLDDASMPGAGLAIDNVKVFATSNADWPPTGNYSVFLDDDFVNETEDTSYRYLNLIYGTEYISGVAANYESGLSDTSFFNFTSEWLFPPENIHLNDSNFLVWQTPRAPWPSRDSIPVNLLGFNIYNNGELMEWLNYVSGDSIVYTEPSNFLPCTYDLEVTAVYDLTALGYPGQQGESTPDFKPDGLQVIDGDTLPLVETWESLSFETNLWERESDNWQIIEDSGNLAPCVQFGGQPTLENYNLGLITNYLNATDTDNEMLQLSFDYKIDINDSAAFTEKLSIMLWSECEWFELQTLTAHADMNWRHLNIDLNQAQGSTLKIAFICKGINSSLINYWQLDNIKIEKACPRPNPGLCSVMDINPAYAVVNLNWVYDSPPWGDWFYEHDGSFELQIASTSGGQGLGQVIDASIFPSYYITSIRYFNSSLDNYWQLMEIYILNANGNTILSGPYLVENGPSDDWVQIEIDPVYMVEPKFMIATFTVSPDGPYVGIDGSHHNETLFFGGVNSMVKLENYGYYYVGSHEAFVFPGGKSQGVYKELDIPTDPNIINGQNIKTGGKFLKPKSLENKNLYKGFNIWRNGELIKENVQTTQFYDTIFEPGNYCYSVSTLYDYCESDTCGLICTSFYVDINESKKNNNIKVYPNPAKELITIESTSALLQITVLDIRGKVKNRIETQGEESIQINTSDFENGIYFIKIKTEEGEHTEKVAVIK